MNESFSLAYYCQNSYLRVIEVIVGDNKFLSIYINNKIVEDKELKKSYKEIQKNLIRSLVSKPIRTSSNLFNGVHDWIERILEPTNQLLKQYYFVIKKLDKKGSKATELFLDSYNESDKISYKRNEENDFQKAFEEKKINHINSSSEYKDIKEYYDLIKQTDYKNRFEKFYTENKKLSIDIIENQIFKGRENIIKDIKHKFDNNNNNNIVLLTGFGGMGKTSICKQYYHNNKNYFEYHGYFPIEDDFKTSIVRNFDNCGFKIKNSSEYKNRISNSNQKVYDYTNVKVFIESIKQSTLIIFNDVKEKHKSDLEAFLSGLGDNFKILINSRETNVLDNSKINHDIIFLDQMGEEEAIEMFKAYHSRNITYTNEENDTIKKIVKRSGYYPLFIEILAKTHRAEIGISTLEELLNKLKGNTFYYSSSTPTIWSGSSPNKYKSYIDILLNLQNFSDEQKEILDIASLLPEKGLKKELFIEFVGVNKTQVINTLIETHWIKEDSNNNIYMIEALKDHFRSILGKDGYQHKYKDFLNKFFEHIEKEIKISYISCFEYDEYLEKINNILENEEPKTDITYLEYIDLNIYLNKIKYYKGQNKEAKKYGDKYMELIKNNKNELIKNKNIEKISRAFSDMALTSLENNDFNESLKYIDEDIKNWALKCNKVSRKAIPHNTKGRVYIRKYEVNNINSNKDYAINSFQEAIKIMEKELNINVNTDFENISIDMENYRFLSLFYNNIALAYCKYNDLNNAKIYCEKSIIIKEKIFALDENDTNKMNLALSYYTLANILFKKKELDNAKEEIKKAIKIMEEQLKNNQALSNKIRICKFYKLLLSIIEDTQNQQNQETQEIKNKYEKIIDENKDIEEKKIDYLEFH